MIRPLSTLLFGLSLAVATGADEARKFAFVDIQPPGNHAMKDDMGANFPGNNLSSLPLGEQTLEGTPFKVGGKMIRIRGLNEDVFPERVEGIKVDAKFVKLHILHATEFRVEDGAEDKAIGAYIIHYADKSE
jgi:hypothetical protein